MGRNVATSSTYRPTDRRGLNAVAATAFVIGGSLFAVGAALAQADVGGPRLVAGVYLAGGVFFSTGGAASVRLARGKPPLEELSALVLFVGTLVFAINLIDSLIGDLSPAQYDRLVWSPDMVGCALFLVSGHLAMVQISRHLAALLAPRRSGLANRRRQPARLPALHGLRHRLPGPRRRRHDRGRPRQLGHPHRRPLLRRRRRAPRVPATRTRGRWADMSRQGRHIGPSAGSERMR